MMDRDNHAIDVRVSNWTLATGTRPGERVAQASREKDASAPISCVQTHGA
jgi:hypothetical protein